MPLVVLSREAKTYHSDKNLNHTLCHVASPPFSLSDIRNQLPDETPKAASTVSWVELLAFYHFPAITNISKFSVVNSSFRLKAPNFAPNISILLKLNDFKSHVISDGT